MRLVDHLDSDPRPGRMADTYLGGRPLWPESAPSGIFIDGAWYPLDGQPPPARVGSWGDMGWTRHPRTGG